MEYHTDIGEDGYEDNNDMEKSHKWEINTEQEIVCRVGFPLSPPALKLLYMGKRVESKRKFIKILTAVLVM